MTTTTDNLNTALTNFSNHFSEMCEQKLFNDMLVTVTSISYQALENRNEEPLDAEAYDECIREILKTVKTAKRQFGNQLSTFHKLVSSLVISLDSTSEPPDSINKKVKALSAWLVNFKVEVEQKRTSDNLIDFYNELEDLRDQFRDLSKVSNELKDRNKAYRIEEAGLKKELANMKKNDQKLKKKNSRLKKDYDELKKKYNDLYSQFSNLLSSRNPEGTEVTYIKEPANKENMNGVWFDIEKSQQRYESLLDSYMRVIREKDERIKELEDEIQGLRGKTREVGENADKEKDRLCDKIRQLESENLDLRDACIKLKKNLDEKQEQLDHANAIRDQLQNFKDKMNESQTASAKKRGLVDEKIRELEDNNADLEEKLMKALQRETNYLSGRADTKDLIEGAKIINEEKQIESDRRRHQSHELKKENLILRDRLVELEDELMNLKKEYEDLNVLAHEKEIDVERLKNELTKSRKRDDKSRRVKDSLSKKKTKLENKLADREVQINQLQRQLESQELKLIKMAKLIDRLRFENEKFKNNYRLTQTFSPRKYANLPPTVRDLSPEPLRIPPVNQRYRSRSSDAHINKNPSFRAGPETFSNNNTNEKIGTFAFIKSTAVDNMSPYMYREDNKLVVAGPKKGTKYERSSNGSFLDKRFMPFKGIFTQFELDLMSSEMSNIFNSQTNNIFVIYGSPLNIKLFVMHKAIHVFLSKVKLIIDSDNSSCLEVIIEDSLADFILSHFKDETSTGLCNKSNYKGIFKLVRLDAKIPYLIDSLKKLFFNILSNSSAKIVDFLAVEIVEHKSISDNQKLILVRSSIEKSPSPSRSFQEVLNEFMYASRFKNVEDMMGVVRDMSISGFSKQFFLVLEPGKVNTYEDTYNFLEIHNSVENIRVEQKMSLRNRQSGMIYG